VPIDLAGRAVLTIFWRAFPIPETGLFLEEATPFIAFGLDGHKMSRVTLTAVALFDTQKSIHQKKKSGGEFKPIPKGQLNQRIPETDTLFALHTSVNPGYGA